MENNYKEIEFNFGNIEDAIQLLNQYKEKGELVFGVFNGQKLFSDKDDVDSAYLKITGRTKAQFDEEERIGHEKYLEEKKKHEETIPKQTKHWISKARGILRKKYRSKWNRCVPIRLNDLYRGYELGACLEIVKDLNSRSNFESAKQIIENQGHSGMSYGLVCSMVKSFCDRGNEFVSYLNEKQS